MKAPPGYLKPGDEGKVCKLLKGLYGVKQAGHEWYLKLCGTFNELKFIRSHADHSVFYKCGDEPIIVTVSTDDMTLAAKPLAMIEKLKNDLQGHYEISDLGELRWLLGVKVKHDWIAWMISLSLRRPTSRRSSGSLILTTRLLSLYWLNLALCSELINAQRPRLRSRTWRTSHTHME
jgi:hypothetical protein